MPSLRSWIDEPSAASVESPGVCLRGWCFEETGRRIEAVRARVRGRAVPGRCGLPRPDVQAAFNGPAESGRSGFTVRLTLGPGRSRIRLEARLEGERSWAVFRELELSTPWSDALPHRIRMARFALESLLGRPGSLARLKPAEKAQVFSRIEEDGGHPLRLSPHYPPRPVQPERFPRPRLHAGRLPRLTVVTPSFQHGAFLEATIKSVLGQEGVSIDYIVQDGGSTDETLKLLWRYAPRLKRWESEPDQGQADALRRGFEGIDIRPDDLMAYLNSDDLLMPGAAQFVAEYFARHPQVDVVYGHRVLIDEEGREVGRWLAPRMACDDLRLQDLIPQETLFWRRRVWDRVGGVDPAFHFAVDWDLILRFRAAGARFARLPHFLGMFRLHPAQKSQARLEEVGIPEMDALRARSLGRTPSREELVASMERAQLDSAVLARLIRRGWRL